MTAASRPDWFGDHSAARPPRVPSGPVVGVVAAGLALFLSVTVTAGLLFWGESAERSTQRSASTAAELGGIAPVGQLDPATGTARIGSASLVLPDEPYVTHPDPRPLDGVFDLFFWAAATVHPRYDGRHDWSSAVLLGRLSSPSGSGDLEVDGRQTVEQLSRSFFGAHATQVRDFTAADHAIDGHPGVLVSATVHYGAANLPSRADRVTALLVRLDDGSVVVAAAAVPDDTDPAVAQQAADALRTLTVD